jgi:hypothetical protein
MAGFPVFPCNSGRTLDAPTRCGFLPSLGASPGSVSRQGDGATPPTVQKMTYNELTLLWLNSRSSPVTR